jgi:dienelactone hydrolase
MKEVFANMDAGVARFQAAKAILEKHASTDPTKIAAIGYCFGGAIVLYMARSGLDLDGVASFHGNLAGSVPAKPGKLKASILVAAGAADPFVKPEDIAAFKADMKAAGADLTYRSYEGAKHSFTNPAATARGQKFGLPLEYNEAADKASWAELEKFLKKVFK